LVFRQTIKKSDCLRVLIQNSGYYNILIEEEKPQEMNACGVLITSPFNKLCFTSLFQHDSISFAKTMPL